jgi:O-antigen ligase
MSAQALPSAPVDCGIWRGVTFVGGLALAWVTLQPFADLGAPDALDLGAGREIASYAVFAGCAALCLYLAATEDSPALSLIANPAFIGMALWAALSSVASQDPATSVKRAALCAFVATIAATLPLLPRGRGHLAILLAAAAGALLTLCYFGVSVMPRFAIHQASDIGEPALAGDWRGVFGHKNTASVIFVFAGFIGLYVARTTNTALGGAIGVLSLIFVIFANGKTASMMWAPALAIGLFAARFGASRRWAVVALAPFVALMGLGVGSVVLAPLAALTASLPIDASFTGRTDVWRYALGKLAAHPLLGYGFDSFWNTQSVRYGTDSPTAWVAGAAHAHNGIVDIAVSMGIPGVIFALWAFVAQPLADIRSASRRKTDPALLTLFVQIWLMGIYMTSLESFLFDRADPIWFTFLFAVFGLRYVGNLRSSP